MERDRMYRVIVLGGIGLVACGGSVTTAPGEPTDASADSPVDVSFPFELPAPYDATPPPPDAFPSELPAMIDASPPDAAARDASPDAFPTEGPPPFDSGGG
jgi:hypothetical protein